MIRFSSTETILFDLAGPRANAFEACKYKSQAESHSDFELWTRSEFVNKNWKRELFSVKNQPLKMKLYLVSAFLLLAVLTGKRHWNVPTVY